MIRSRTVPCVARGRVPKRWCVAVVVLSVVAATLGAAPVRALSRVSGSATSLNLPGRVLADGRGNVYVSDTFAHTVRRLDSAGAMTTVAGTGVSGFAGDGGPAATAQLSFPLGLALDARGDLFIADEGNNRVREIDPSGTISTVAGDGNGGEGLAMPAANGDEGPATAAQISRPYGVAVDAHGVLYIADTLHFRVRSVTTDGVIHAFAGTGGYAASGDGGPAAEATFLFPTSVAVDSAGNVYIAEFYQNRVRKVDAATAIVSTFAGQATGAPGASGDGGPATAAMLSQPYDVSIDPAGNLLIADSGNHVVRRVDSSGSISLVAGSYTPGFAGDGAAASVAQLDGPFGISGDGKAVYIADEGNNRVRRADAAGVMSTVAGNDTQAVPSSTFHTADPSGVPQIKHIFEIVLENEESTSVYDSAKAPYFNSLVGSAVRLDAMYGAGHASLDNYQAMFGGVLPNPNSQLDCSAVAPGCSVPADPRGAPTNIGDQLDAAGLPWKVYAESMPAPCTYSPTAPTSYNAGYAERHNPGVFFQSLTGDPQRCAAHVVPYLDGSGNGLAADLASESTTPSYSLIVPNSLDDGHDNPPGLAGADTWLSENLPAILNSPAYLDNGMVIVTFDEGTSTQGCCSANPGGGYIATLVLSPLARQGVRSSVPYNHFSVLRTIEDALGVPLLNHAGDTAVTPFGTDVWSAGQ